MKYKEFIENNTIKCDASHRGGTIKINVAELFPGVNEPIMGAYQNYLGGGMAGAVVGASMFSPEELTEKEIIVFNELKENIKQYFHEITNGVNNDEWATSNYKSNQSRPISAY